MVVLAQVVVVELDERLDGFLHGAHLDQGHLAVLPDKQQQQKAKTMSVCLFVKAAATWTEKCL